jgi:hypothetical protein
MIFGKTLDNPAIQINGRLLEQVKSDVYRGHKIKEDGKGDKRSEKESAWPKVPSST